MPLTGKTLVRIDRLFWLPHRLVDRIVSSMHRVAAQPGEEVLVMKFMGIGSIIRFASLCEERNVDKSKIILITLASKRELCQLLGFTRTRMVRTQNIFVFLIDCWRILVDSKSNRSSVIIDYERCSHAVALFRGLLLLRTGGTSVSFENNKGLNSPRQLILPVEGFNLEELFLKGIEWMPLSLGLKSRDTVTINSNRILININASDYLLARRYPIDSFEELIRALYAWDPTLDFYLTGSSRESKYVEGLTKRTPDLPVHNVCGKWDLERLWKELAGCALFITGDSGPLHLAAYLKIPTVALWGPTQPAHFGYASENHLQNVSLELKCSPCFKHPASRPARICNGRIDCLKELPSAKITAKVISLLSNLPASRLVRFPEVEVTRAFTESLPVT